MFWTDLSQWLIVKHIFHEKGTRLETFLFKFIWDICLITSRWIIARIHTLKNSQLRSTVDWPRTNFGIFSIPTSIQVRTVNFRIHTSAISPKHCIAKLCFPVPDYDVVRVAHTFKNSTGNSLKTVKLKPFGNDIELYLHPVESIFAETNLPVYCAHSDSSKPFGINFKKPRMVLKCIVEYWARSLGV